MHWNAIQSDNITRYICAIIHTDVPITGFMESGISTQSLDSGVTIDVIIARDDPDTIQIAIRWWRNTIRRYLHTTVMYFIQALSAQMVQYGAYMIIPSAHIDL